MKKIFVHPELNPEKELMLGNLELDHKEVEDFSLVQQATGLKTIRISRETYSESGEKIRQMQGICDIFGPFPLFIKKSELEELQQKYKYMTPRTLFKKIINRELINT